MNLLDGRYSIADRTIRVADARPPVGGVGWKDGEKSRLAMRPEDVQPAPSMGGPVFHGTVEVVMDLGHFRQVELLPHDRSRLKIFAPKDRRVSSGERQRVIPMRCLAYTGKSEPVEVPVTSPLALAQ